MDLADLLEWPRRGDVPGMLFRRLISRHSIVGIDSMTRAEQVLWLVFELCGEVSNGGIDQLFSNSSGDRAHLVPTALRDLGHPALAAAFEGVARGFSRDRVERNHQLSALSEAQRAAMQAVEDQIDAATGSLLLELVGWIAARAGEFQFPNAGLAAFRPVDVPPDLPLDEIFAEGVGPEEALPALYIRWAARSDLSSVERALQAALHAFGEISDEGPVSYFFSRRGGDALAARAGLEAAGADAAARVLGQALGAFEFTPELLNRRARLEALTDDARAVLGRLQWAMDDLREETMTSLLETARRQRAELR